MDSIKSFFSGMSTWCIARKNNMFSGCSRLWKAVSGIFPKAKEANKETVPLTKKNVTTSPTSNNKWGNFFTNLFSRKTTKELEVRKADEPKNKQTTEISDEATQKHYAEMNSNKNAHQNFLGFPFA
jgi:hypothetical protein